MADGPNKPNRPIRPRQGAPGRKRRVVIEGAGGQRGRDGGRGRARPTAAAKGEKQEGAAPSGPWTVPPGVTDCDYSQGLCIPAAQIMKIMMDFGNIVQITKSLSDAEV